QPAEAEAEFVKLLAIAPDDLLTLAQVGLLRLSRNDVSGAMPLIEKVLKGKDEDLARRLRDVLNAKPQTAPMGPSAATPRPPSLDPKAMGDKSYAAGYLNDALRYYRAALESNPEDHEVQLKLGRTYNMLRQDSEAFRYFEMARAS